jgi:hypothetical protein
MKRPKKSNVFMWNKMASWMWYIAPTIATWTMILTAAIVCMYILHNFQKDLFDKQQKSPRIVGVKACSTTLPRGNIVDGVSIQPGDSVLILSANGPKWWDLDTQLKWRRTDKLRLFMPGSIIQVERGLQYAHQGFMIRSADDVIPLWQHVLLQHQRMPPRSTNIQLKMNGNILEAVRTKQKSAN